MRRAAASLDWDPEHGDCCRHLVFTSPGLDRDGIERLLDSCLLTEAEYAAGREGWKQRPAGFAPLLDHASWGRAGYFSRSWYIFRVCSVCARMIAVAACPSRAAMAAISSRCSTQDWRPRWRATGV